METGTSLRNESSSYIEDYMVRKALSEIGVTFDGEQLTDFEVEYLAVIGAAIKEVEKRQAKKMNQQKGRAHGRR